MVGSCAAKSRRGRPKGSGKKTTMKVLAMEGSKKGTKYDERDALGLAKEWVIESRSSMHLKIQCGPRAPRFVRNVLR